LQKLFMNLHRRHLRQWQSRHQ